MIPVWLAKRCRTSKETRISPIPANSRHLARIGGNWNKHGMAFPTKNKIFSFALNSLDHPMLSR